MTELQHRFVQEYIANGFRNAKDAALKAGAAESTAKEAYRSFLGSDTVKAELDAVRAMIRQAGRDRLLGLADKGIAALEAVIDDKKAPATAKTSAAKALIEMAGVGEPIKHEHTGKDGEPIQHAVIVTLRDRLAVLRRERGAAESGGDGPEPS